MVDPAMRWDEGKWRVSCGELSRRVQWGEQAGQWRNQWQWRRQGADTIPPAPPDQSLAPPPASTLILKIPSYPLVQITLHTGILKMSPTQWVGDRNIQVQLISADKLPLPATFELVMKLPSWSSYATSVWKLLLSAWYLWTWPLWVPLITLLIGPIKGNW